METEQMGEAVDVLLYANKKKKCHSHSSVIIYYIFEGKLLTMQRPHPSLKNDDGYPMKILFDAARKAGYNT